MLTRRAAKSILRFLPNEILTEIIAVSPPTTQAALCRASRLFNKLATCFLYRTIVLTTVPALDRCCRTLKNRREEALLVKSFDISGCVMDLEIFDIHSFNMSQALVSMKNLESLTFAFGKSAPPYILAVAQTTFPHLRRLLIRVTPFYEKNLTEFLARHPALTVLKLFGRSPFLADLDAVTFPNLRYLKAHAGALAPVIRGNRLTGAEVSWHAPTEDIAQPTAALRAGSADSLVKLVCFRPGANVDLIAHVAEHLPCVAVLKVIAPSALQPAAHDKATVQAIAAALTRFTQLRTFEYTYCLRVNRFEDRVTVISWARVCPTLKQCTLNGVIWKRRLSTGEWRCMRKRT
ncbi:hypothetical protein B0H10DRAFT_85730 [Mycena sp. CBHHK59/15]|nr:hypothetical protein B0H10DRAFT_85730 [Mycena sp. CBHHK59/15]